MSTPSRPATHRLVRHWQDGSVPQTETAQCHPALPGARAIAALAHHTRLVILGHGADDPQTIQWGGGEQHRPWSAVRNLHRAGHHDDAMTVARLLTWCETRYTAEQVRAWELEPLAPEPTHPSLLDLLPAPERTTS